MEPRGSLLPHRASLIPSPLLSAWEPSAGTVPTALPPGGSPSVGGIVGHRLAWDRRSGEKSREYGRPLSLRGHRVSDGPRVNDGRGTPGRAPGLADRRSGGPQGRRLTRTVAPESLRSRRLRWTVPEVLLWGCRRPGDGRGGPSRRRCGSWNVLGGGRVLQARRCCRGVSEGGVPSPVAATHLLSRQTEARTAGRAAGPAAPRARLRFAGEPRMVRAVRTRVS